MAFIDEIDVNLGASRQITANFIHLVERILCRAISRHGEINPQKTSPNEKRMNA
jgi:hypothetical protein